MPNPPTRIVHTYLDPNCQTCFALDVNVRFPEGQKQIKGKLTLTTKTIKGVRVRAITVRNSP